MLRPNEIYEKSFDKVDDGFYSAKEVDAFMEEVASSYEQVFKQNGELVRRLSLLANRLEAYRRQEEQAKKNAEKDKDEEFNDSLKAKLDQAKAVAQKMLDEAKQRAVGIVDNANAESDRILVDLKDKIKEQKVTLDLLNAQSEAFKKKLLDTYREHLIIIDSIPTQAEKIVKESKPDTEEKTDSERTEYPVEDDNSDIFSQADEFVEKLDEPVENITTQEAEDTVEEEPSETVEDLFTDEDINADKSSQEKIIIPEESQDVFSGVDESSNEAFVSEENAEENSVETTEETVKSDEGFDFDFSNISFDDEDDEEIFDDDEENDVVISDDEENGFDGSVNFVDEKQNVIADVFSSDEETTVNKDALNKTSTEDLEVEAESESASRPSLKDIIRAKGSIDEADIEIVSADDEDLDVDFSNDGENLVENIMNKQDSVND